MPGSSVSAWANFNPMLLKPLLWLDAADTSTITSSGSPATVSQWDDKSGYGRHATQATSANQPITGATTKNGLNIIDFNGSSSFMTTSSFTVPQPATYFFAYASIDKASYYVFDGATTRQAFGNGLVTTAVLAAFAGGTGCEVSITHPIAEAFAVVFYGASSQIYRKGVSVDTGDAGTNQSTGGIRLGTRFNAGGTFLQGSMYEIVVCSGVASFENVQQMGFYFANKWGL